MEHVIAWLLVVVGAVSLGYGIHCSDHVTGTLGFASTAFGLYGVSH